MYDIISVEYVPFGNIKHVKKIEIGSLYKFYGFLIMANDSRISENISIKRSNNENIDFKHIVMKILEEDQKHLEYSANFGERSIAFKNLEFITGAQRLCILFGMDPRSMITDIKQKDVPILVDFKIYFNKILIPNFTIYSNGTVIDVNQLQEIIDTKIIDSLSKNLIDCFPGSNAGIIIPSDLYIISTDEDAFSIITSANITKNILTNLLPYVSDRKNTYYISNVCSLTPYRGQGLTKSIMIAIINDYHQNHQAKIFLLQVLTTNIIAYNLYLSLGFKFIHSDTINHETYDLLQLSI